MNKERIRAKNKAWYEANLEKARAQKKDYYEANKERLRERDKIYNKVNRDKRREYYEANKEKHREYTLLRKYGLTLSAHATLLAGQGGSCAVCRGTDWGQIGPVVDHCHTTLRVRGILCSPCNIAIGLLKDDPRVACAVVSYLEG